MMRTLICADCGGAFEAPARTGSPPTRCPLHHSGYLNCESCGARCRPKAGNRICSDCKKAPCVICGTIGTGYRFCSADCRQAYALRPKVETCIVCGASYTTRNRKTRSCSPPCSAKLISVAATGRIRPVTARPCADCRTETASRSPRAFCEACRKSRRRARESRKNAVRRGAAVVGPPMTIEQLGERDGWRCHLCAKRVNRALNYPHPQSSSFDHLTPVSLGGTDAPTNLALAHLRCNVSRGNRGIVQLLLVG